MLSYTFGKYESLKPFVDANLVIFENPDRYTWIY